MKRNKLCAYLMLLVLSIFSFGYSNAQTLNDIDTVWTTTVPMRSSFINMFVLTNGNYLAYGWNGYHPNTSYNTGNHTGATRNEFYLVEFTEAGNIIRYKTFEAPMPTNNFSDTQGRNFITHTRVVERTDGGLLVLSEYEHGTGSSANAANTMTDKYRFSRVILDSQWNIVTSGMHGIQFDNFVFNGVTYDKVVATRLFEYTRTDDGRILATYRGLKFLGTAKSNFQAAIFLDDNGDPAPPAGQSADKSLKIFAIDGAYTTTHLARAGNRYIFSENGPNIYISTDLQCNAFEEFEAIPVCSQCHNTYYSKPIPQNLPNSGGYLVVGTAGNMASPYLDNSYQAGGWRWNNNMNIVSPTPYWFSDNRLAGSLFLMNNAKYDAVSQDRFLLVSTEYETNSTTVKKSNIAEFVVSSTGLVFNDTGTDVIGKPGFNLRSLDNDGIMGGGNKVVDGETRMMIGKYSLCAGFQLTATDNKSYVSGTIPSYSFTASGEFPGANVSYSWRVILKSGKLSSHPAATVGSELATGNTNSVPSITYTVDGDEPAVVIVEYRATQKWGNPEQECNTMSSYEIVLHPYPDNISDADCVIEAEATDWSIKELNIPVGSTATVHNYGPLVVGDIDGDGEVEILGYKEDLRTGLPFLSTGIRTFHYDNGIIKLKREFTFNQAAGSDLVDAGTFGSFAIARYNNKGYIVVPGNNRYLYAFDHMGNFLWKSDQPYTIITTVTTSLVNIADFNTDGIPEVYIGNRIFSLATGKLLCEGGNANNMGALRGNCHTVGYSTMAADIDGDGLLELCAGTQIYKVTINDPNDFSQNSMTLMSGWQLNATLPTYAYKDGATQVADIDGDGKLEIIVISHENATGVGRVVAYVWKPLENGNSYLMGSFVNATVTNAGYYSVPMIGNIDDDKYLEILFLTNGLNRIYALKYNPNATIGNQIEKKWEVAHTDNSGCTGMTLFDFNLDGQNEIVYRDETCLRIFDGDGNVMPGAQFNNVTSGTLREFPVIADIDGDGQAEIIVTGGTTVYPQNGHVRVFKSDGFPWAPARKVWNQYAYNVVNVNEDLTIPKVQLSPTTAFPGPDGILGTADDIYPFNSFMQQQTILNKNGTPLWLAPNVVIDGSPSFNYDAGKDSLFITVKVDNTGDAAIQNPFFITVYKDGVGNAVKFTYQYNNSIMHGQSATITFGMPYLSWIGAFDENTKLVIKINDNGDGLAHQAVCEENNTISEKLLSSMLMTNNDFVATMEETPVTIGVLGNDSIPAACTPALTISKQPLNGLASVNVSGDSIIYTPNAGFVGYDTLTYQVECFGDVSLAKVYLIVQEKPDNIIEEEDCFVDGEKFDFTIKQLWQNTTDYIHSFSGVLVGDLDNDGVSELVTVNSNYTAINIYDGETGILKDAINMPSIYNGMASPSPAVLVDADRNGMGEIIFTTNDNRLLSYEADTTGGVFTMKHKWTSATPVNNPVISNAQKNVPHLVVADFNGDGIPELVTYNQIYNAVTGEYLGQTEPFASAYFGHPKYVFDNSAYGYINFQTVADIDGDGLPEIIAGGKVYKVNFNASKTAVTCDILHQHTSVPDGFTAVADIDMDGTLDVIVIDGPATSTVRVTIWNPATQSIIGQITQNSRLRRFSFPFVGDIDGKVASDGKLHPEICIVAGHASGQGILYAFKYVPEAAQKIQLKWSMVNSDDSGATSITLFDFNNDGINELVYRDMTHLYILDGREDNQSPALALPAGLNPDYPDGSRFVCASGTAWEYPTIVDVDGDGSANICITCWVNGNNNGKLTVFESASQPWLSTRKVWNQLSYEPLYINDDLTVPRYPIAKNTKFGDVYPYNGTLIQVPTMVNKDFKPVMPAADPGVDRMWLESLNETTIRVWVQITNNGVKNTNSGLPMAIYGVNPPPSTAGGADLIDTKPVGEIIKPGETLSVYFDVPVLLVTDVFSVRIQDDGVNYPALGSYLDCDYDNNTGFVSSLLAVDDIVYTTTNVPLTFDALANDIFGACARNTLTEFDTIANSGLHLGSLSINADSTFTYSPDLAKVGVDSLDYYIKCAADSSAARVYILVHKPVSLQYVACPGSEVEVGFNPINGVTYNWYDAVSGGNLLMTGNSFTVTKDNSVEQVWYVEPVWKNIKFPRYQVILQLSTYCGNTEASGCAETGTRIYFEDFGGNNPSDPVVSPVDIIGGRSDLSFSSTGPLSGHYALTKYYNTYAGFWQNDDHTYWDDLTRGYYMYIDPASNQMDAVLYEYEIKDLCSGAKLSFTAWAADLGTNSGQARPKIEMVISDARTKDTLVRSGIFLLERETQKLNWRQYGFDFYLPQGVDSITFTILNKEINNIGNDWILDDIEIYICTPEIEFNVTDTVACHGTEFEIKAVYEEDCTFGNELTYRWEYKATGSDTWETLKQEDVTVDCSAYPANVLNSSWVINSVSPDYDGYYRILVSSLGNIDRVNCRASSDSVFVQSSGKSALPDIRIQACSGVGLINLSSYLDTVDVKRLEWSVNVGPTVDASGNINTSGLQYPNTYSYIYKIENSCFTPEGRLYVKTLNDKSIGLPPDTVVVCYENAENLNLNRIMGIEAGGTYSADSEVKGYLRQVAAPSVFAGAQIFDGRDAYVNLSSTYDYVYKSDNQAKKVEIKYTVNDLGSCLYNEEYTLVIILTSVII